MTSASSSAVPDPEITMGLPTFDPIAFRAHFTALDTLTHLASCSQGALSDAVRESQSHMKSLMDEEGAPWGAWMGVVEHSRESFARLVGAPSTAIAVLPSASESAYQAVSSLEWSQRPGIVTSPAEFPSLGQMLRAQEARGAEVRSLESRESALDPAAWTDLIDETVGLVSIPLTSYHDGALLPVREVAAAARAAGARVLVDAYQGAGVVPVDVTELDVDYLVTGTLKYLLGLAGQAFLYARPGLTDHRSPELTGWFGRRDPFAFDPTLLDHPEEARRFEVGTPSVPAAYASAAALDLLGSLDQRAAWAHVEELREALRKGVAELGLRVSSPTGAAAGPQVAIEVEDPAALSAALLERRIATAPRGRLLRMSLHYYSDEDDITRTLTALRALL